MLYQSEVQPSGLLLALPCILTLDEVHVVVDRPSPALAYLDHVADSLRYAISWWHQFPVQDHFYRSVEFVAPGFDAGAGGLIRDTSEMASRADGHGKLWSHYRENWPETPKPRTWERKFGNVTRTYSWP